MGYKPFSVDDYREARREYGVTHDIGVTREAEQQARKTGRLSDIVDPAVNPMRCSKIRLNPHSGRWIVTVGCPMDIEVSCDTTGSMGGEVDTEMRILPDLCGAVAQVLPDYDPQLCLGIFGDVRDDFVLCRPQFEMEAPKIVRYLKEMAPQRDGGDYPEDPQYAMFARAYLTDAYTNRIGLKGYNFIVTDAICHGVIERGTIKRIFGEDVFSNELKNMNQIPTMEKMIADLKRKTHQFILLVGEHNSNLVDFWSELCGRRSVIEIVSTKFLPKVISAIIGLTEGTLDITELKRYCASDVDARTFSQLCNIDIGAQLELRHALPYPAPKAGDIFMKKGDSWPIQPDELTSKEEPVETEGIEYL